MVAPLAVTAVDARSDVQGSLACPGLHSHTVFDGAVLGFTIVSLASDEADASPETAITSVSAPSTAIVGMRSDFLLPEP